MMLLLLLMSPPVKAPDELVIKSVSDLQVGEGGWIGKNAILIDLQRHMWINKDYPIQEYEVKGHQPDSSYRLLWVRKSPKGYEVFLPRRNYEYKPWVSGPKYFRWKLETTPTTGNSIYALNNWKPIVKFQIYR